MKAYTFYIGLTTRNGAPVLDGAPIPRIQDAIYGRLKKWGVDGCTMHIAYGVWKDKWEACMVVYFHMAAAWGAEELARLVAEDLEQDCVAYHESPVLTFVTPTPDADPVEGPAHHLGRDMLPTN